MALLTIPFYTHQSPPVKGELLGESIFLRLARRSVCLAKKMVEDQGRQRDQSTTIVVMLGISRGWGRRK